MNYYDSYSTGDEAIYFSYTIEVETVYDNISVSFDSNWEELDVVDDGQGNIRLNNIPSLPGGGFSGSVPPCTPNSDYFRGNLCDDYNGVAAKILEDTSPGVVSALASLLHAAEICGPAVYTVSAFVGCIILGGAWLEVLTVGGLIMSEVIQWVLDCVLDFTAPAPSSTTPVVLTGGFRPIDVAGSTDTALPTSLFIRRSQFVPILT